MANISAAQVKDLREKTGAPMMDCKQALTEAKGDMEQAVVILRKKGVSVAAKKATPVGITETRLGLTYWRKNARSFSETANT